MPTETRTYVGETGNQAFDGYAGLRIGQRYTGVVQESGRVLGTGVVVTGVEWEK